MLNEQIVEALTRLTDGIEQLEQRIRRMEDTYIGSLRHNEYGLTDYERHVGWRLLKTALGEEPKKLVGTIPPEPKTTVAPEAPTPIISVIDEPESS